MRSKIKSVLSLTLAFCSMVSLSSTAFCTKGDKKSKQFLSKDDYWTLENVIRKAEYDAARESQQYSRFVSKRVYSPSINTYVVENNSDFKPITFGDIYRKMDYDCSFDTIIYKADSFDFNLFERIVKANNVKGVMESIEPLDFEGDYGFYTNIVKNGYKYVLTNNSTGETIEFEFVFGKTRPLSDEKSSLKSAIKAYNQYVKIFISKGVYNPYGIVLSKVDESYINKDVVSDIVKFSGPSIAKECFKNCQFLKAVSMPNVRAIREEAFKNCKYLEKVYIPATEEIESNAFYGCDSLRNISLPNVKFIDSSVFEGCKNLESVYIPQVQYISEYAFKGCKKLKYISLPQSARVMSITAFQDCDSNLKINYDGETYRSFNEFVEKYRS